MVSLLKNRIKEKKTKFFISGWYVFISVVISVLIGFVIYSSINLGIYLSKVNMLDDANLSHYVQESFSFITLSVAVYLMLSIMLGFFLVNMFCSAIEQYLKLIRFNIENGYDLPNFVSNYDIELVERMIYLDSKKGLTAKNKNNSEIENNKNENKIEEDNDSNNEEKIKEKDGEKETKDERS